jgi:hypothetical protein
LFFSFKIKNPFFGKTHTKMRGGCGRFHKKVSIRVNVVNLKKTKAVSQAQKTSFCDNATNLAKNQKSDFYSLVRFLPRVTVREIVFTPFSFVNAVSRFSLRD